VNAQSYSKPNRVTFQVLVDQEDLEAFDRKHGTGKRISAIADLIRKDIGSKKIPVKKKKTPKEVLDERYTD